MALRVKTSVTPRVNSTVSKVNLDLVNVEELNNVDATGLEDGYTLIYDESSQKWVAQRIEVGGIGNIDGGTY